MCTHVVANFLVIPLLVQDHRHACVSVYSTHQKAKAALGATYMSRHVCTVHVGATAVMYVGVQSIGCRNTYSLV